MSWSGEGRGCSRIFPVSRLRCSGEAGTDFQAPITQSSPHLPTTPTPTYGGGGGEDLRGVQLRFPTCFLQVGMRWGSGENKRQIALIVVNQLALLSGFSSVLAASSLLPALSIDEAGIGSQWRWWAACRYLYAGRGLSPPNPHLFPACFEVVGKAVNAVDFSPIGGAIW